MIQLPIIHELSRHPHLRIPVTKFAVLLYLVFMAPVIVAADCNQDFNGDGICDEYKVENVDEINYVSIDISGMDKRVGGFFDLGRGGLYKGYFSGEMSMALDYYPTNTQMTTYSFRWAPELEDWILYRTASWEELYRNDEFLLMGNQVPPELLISRSFNVKRFPCCIKFSDFSHNDFSLIPMSEDLQKTKINEDFERIRMHISDTGKNKIFASREFETVSPKNLPEEFIYELTLILDARNVVDLNNLGYYLLEGGFPTSAIILLREIHKKFPDRVVATLNLADAYKELEINSEACSLYAEYIDAMHASGRSSRIPKRLNYNVICGSR